jgi:hypothetical protein
VASRIFENLWAPYSNVGIIISPSMLIDYLLSSTAVSDIRTLFFSKSHFSLSNVLTFSRRGWVLKFYHMGCEKRFI